jgi:OOP family OmpA-OmpF porin
MKSLHALRLLTLAGLGTMLVAPAFAQEDTYFYGGLSVGRARGLLDENRVSNSQLGAGLTSAGTTSDERHTAYTAFGGYQFNRYFGLETGYFNLGKSSFSTTTVPAGTLDGTLKVEGLNFDVVGTMPVTDTFAFTGRVGATYARTRDHFTGTGAVVVANPDASKRDAGYKVGVGMQYAFSQSFMVRADAERYRVSDAIGGKANVNVFTASLVFPFGRKEAAAPRAVAPAYVAPVSAPVVVQAPAPVVVAVVTPAPVVLPPERKRVSFAAESLFTFDRSDVKPEGKAALDTFSKELAGTRFDTVMVEGHTDRLGSQAYNQRLSEQRAEAVKSYLVTTGIDQAKVSAVGKSESEPVTKSGDCKGNKANAELIACLQPDRRVDIEVTGTR